MQTWQITHISQKQNESNIKKCLMLINKIKICICKNEGSCLQQFSVYWDYVSFNTYYVPGALLDFAVNWTVSPGSCHVRSFTSRLSNGAMSIPCGERYKRCHRWGGESRALAQGTAGHYGRQQTQLWGNYFFLTVFYTDIFIIEKKMLEFWNASLMSLVFKKIRNTKQFPQLSFTDIPRYSFRPQCLCTWGYYSFMPTFHPILPLSSPICLAKCLFSLWNSA